MYTQLELTLWVKALDDTAAEYTALHGVSAASLVDDVKGSVLRMLNLSQDKAHVSLRLVVRDGAASASGAASGKVPTAAEEARAVPLQPPQTLADAGVVSGDFLVVARVQRGARTPQLHNGACRPVSVRLSDTALWRACLAARCARSRSYAAQARHLACRIPLCLGQSGRPSSRKRVRKPCHSGCVCICDPCMLVVWRRK